MVLSMLGRFVPSATATVGDEVIPSNVKNTSLACHVECLQPA